MLECPKLSENVSNYLKRSKNVGKVEKRTKMKATLENNLPSGILTCAYGGAKYRL